jgi:hypothetical protein
MKFKFRKKFRNFVSENGNLAAFVEVEKKLLMMGC